jgi:hypothetical protein
MFRRKPRMHCSVSGFDVSIETVNNGYFLTVVNLNTNDTYPLKEGRDRLVVRQFLSYSVKSVYLIEEWDPLRDGRRATLMLRENYKKSYVEKHRINYQSSSIVCGEVRGSIMIGP